MPSRSRLAAVAWIGGPLTYLILEAIAAAAFPHYSYARNFISDLGVPSSSPRELLMNAAFCVQGMLFFAGAIFYCRLRLFFALVATNAVGNVLIAIFHSGAAAHADGATLAIVGGNAAILAGRRISGRWHRRVSMILGTFGLLSFAVFVGALKTATGLLGVWERCSVYPILAWQMLTAVWILRNPRGRWSRLGR